MTSQKVIIPPVGFENCVEDRAEKRSGAKKRFDADIQHHARDRDSRNPKLHRAGYDIQREQRIHYVADPRNQPDEAAKAVPKSAGKGESIVEPAREGLHIGNAWVYDLRAQRFALEFLTGGGNDYWRQPPSYQESAIAYLRHGDGAGGGKLEAPRLVAPQRRQPTVKVDYLQRTEVRPPDGGFGDFGVGGQVGMSA